MKKLIYIFILFLAVLVCSCEDNNTEVNFPVTLYASKITDVSDVRLFANKTEITDSETILKFIEDAECFNLPSNIEQSDAILIFHSKDSVSFVPPTFGMDFKVKKNARQFLFYSSQAFFGVNEGDIVHSLCKYIDEIIIPLPPGNRYSGITKEVRVGYGSYSNLDICYFAYKRVKHTEQMSQGVWGTLLNEFNETVINSLQKEDTLAVQEYRVKFIAK